VPVFYVAADTPILGAISSDTTWSPAGGVYIVNSNFSVASGTTLTIEAGTIIKAKISNIYIDGPSIYGRLIVNGTSELPVNFTSYYDDSIGGDTNADGLLSAGAPGQWQGLYFKSGSEGDLNYVDLSYAGVGGYGWGNFVGIENDGGLLNIQNSNIHDNYGVAPDGAGGLITFGTGVYNKSGTLSVFDSSINNNLKGIGALSGVTTISNTVLENNRDSTGRNRGYGIFAQGEGKMTLINNTFINNEKTADINVATEFVHSGNVSSDSEKGFKMGGQIVRDTSLNSNDLPTLISGGISVPAGKVLTLEPGTIIKLGDPRGNGAIRVHGILVAKGTKEAKIYLTSQKDDIVGGDSNGDGNASVPGPRNWNGVFLEAGSKANFDNVTLRYSGFNYNGEYLSGIAAAVYQRGAEFLVSNSLFERNWSMAIYQDAGTTNINRSEFREQSYGILSRGGEINISQSSLHNNTVLAVYNQSGPLIEASNNWWGSPDGPKDASTSTPTGTGDRVSGNVIYKPWLGSDPLLTPSRNPVIIVPGIISSYLNRTDLVIDNERWPNLLLMSLSPDDLYLNDLLLTLEGNTTQSISPTNVLVSIGDFDFFGGLSSQLLEDQEVEAFPYDWRLDIQLSVLKLKEKIDQIKSETGTNKVNLVAHSMGGLVVKEYLKQFGGDFIEKFVDIATPHAGSPKSFKVLSYGDNFGFEKFGLNVLNPERVKIISQNMPSVYQLLPSSLYGNYLYDMDDLDGNGVRGVLSYADTKQFMKNTGRNSTLVDRADIFHQGIDNLDPADYGVETYNIVGCGVQTLGKIFILNKEDSGGVEYNISYINGDGTVPLKSAENIPALKTYYAKNAVHATMPSTSGVKELVASILGGDEDFDISLYSNLAISSDNCKIPNGKIVSFHSPIELHIYSGGKHVGPNTDGDMEINIPGVSYEVIEGNKFAFLPDGTEYIVKGSATASSTFNARIEILEDEVVVETRYFNQVPITPTTQVELRDDTILIDADSDTIFESEFPVSSVLDEGESLDITKPTTTISTSPVSKKDTPFDTPVKVTFLATDDNSGVLITEYSLDSGQSWILYTEPITINARGKNQLLYKSIDRAGNIEPAKVEIITILYPGNSGDKR